MTQPYIHQLLDLREGGEKLRGQESFWTAETFICIITHSGFADGRPLRQCCRMCRQCARRRRPRQASRQEARQRLLGTIRLGAGTCLREAVGLQLPHVVRRPHGAFRVGRHFIVALRQCSATGF